MDKKWPVGAVDPAHDKGPGRNSAHLCIKKHKHIDLRARNGLNLSWPWIESPENIVQTNNSDERFLLWKSRFPEEGISKQLEISKVNELDTLEEVSKDWSEIECYFKHQNNDAKLHRTWKIMETWHCHKLRIISSNWPQWYGDSFFSQQSIQWIAALQKLNKIKSCFSEKINKMDTSF